MMSKKLILLFLPFMLCFLQGCGVYYLGDGRFTIGKNAHKYLDRPRGPSLDQIFQTFVGKHYKELIPYVDKYYKVKGNKVVWGESSYEYGNMFPNSTNPSPTNVSHREVCELIAYIDNNGIIKNITYENDQWFDRKVACPPTSSFSKLSYIVKPELYEYDKKHNIVMKSYIKP